ncbi:YitT family protein [Alicyclobacillus sp. ALC3]|uniref:YitT family protein n=1 Tax=Alicyclobacillus sp. ALC3 TaxID=2796143 RepID=UPI00237808C4|nr:YitT family protein [Alicyclobacillus sp. ALC3]
MLMAAVTVFVEKDSKISSGGVSGLSIGIADLFGLSVGVTNLCIKLSIFLLILLFDSKITAFWTVIGAGITGVFMVLFEHAPVDLDWPRWVAFAFILLFAKLPIALLVSKGLSTGGFTAVAQLIAHRYRTPLWVSLLLLNVLAVAVMYLAHGLVSGLLTAVASLTAGVMVQVWSDVTNRCLDARKTP